MKVKDNEKLGKILDDKRSGSSEILSGLNNFLLLNLNDRKQFNVSLFKANQKLSHFAAISNYLKKLNALTKISDYKNIKEFMNDFKRDEGILYNRIFENVYRKLSSTKTILTISRSGTVIKILKLWFNRKRNLKIIITESRPANEGILTAKELLKEGLKVELITDAMAGLYLPKVDAAIIGADAVLKNKNVINKAGSLSLALLCKHHKKPLYVLAAKSKFVNKTRYKTEPESSEKLWKYRHPNLKVTNIPFEEIDRKLITEIITD